MRILEVYTQNGVGRKCDALICGQWGLTTSFFFFLATGTFEREFEDMVGISQTLLSGIMPGVLGKMLDLYPQTHVKQDFHAIAVFPDIKRLFLTHLKSIGTPNPATSVV